MTDFNSFEYRGADLRKFSTYAIAALAAVIAFYFSHTFSPGLVSFDSWRQFAQVIGQAPISDAHPVIMVFTWRFLQEVFGDPGVMLGFHQILYWSGLATLSCLVFRSGWSRLAALLIVGFCPPLFILTLHVWKDAGMLVGLLWAVTGALGVVRLRQNKTAELASIAVALAGLFYAAAVRVNGFIPAVLLLAALAALILMPRVNGLRRGLALGALFVAAAAAGHGAIVKSMTANVKNDYTFGTLLVWDMVAISLDQNTDLLPPYLTRTVKTDLLTDLRETFSGEANYNSFGIISPYPKAEDQGRLVSDWLSLVGKYPGPYLRHRLHVLKVLLGLQPGPVYYPFHRGIDENPVGLEFKFMSAPDLSGWIAKFDRMANSLLYRPWVYALLAIATAAYGLLRLFRKRGSATLNLLAVATSLSGLANAAALMFLATAADYRYITWLPMAALLATLILTAGVWESRSAAADAALRSMLATAGRLVFGQAAKVQMPDR